HLLGLLDLEDGRTGVADREEQLRILVEARGTVAPIHGWGILFPWTTGQVCLAVGLAGAAASWAGLSERIHERHPPAWQLLERETTPKFRTVRHRTAQRGARTGPPRLVACPLRPGSTHPRRWSRPPRWRLSRAWSSASTGCSSCSA